jgi:hypothetical protein
MTCKSILENAGIQKTVNATEPFTMGSVDISDFVALNSMKCWINHNILYPQKS